MIIILKTHGLRVKFSRALRDAIFLPNATDKRQIESYLARQSPPITFAEKVQSNLSWIKKHCKHVVPPPEQLYPIVSGLFQDYGPLKDAQTGIPLFNAQAWQTVKKILELIQKGYISDPPGVALYYCIGICNKTKLPIYHDWRGTNLTEGGVHWPRVCHSLPIGGVSVRHTSNRLTDFVFHHNMLVGIFNMTGKRYRDHFDLWVINELQELLNNSYTRQLVPEAQSAIGWVNGNLYTQTTEVFGILPVPSDVQTSAGMTPFDPTNPPQSHLYLAKKQGT